MIGGLTYNFLPFMILPIYVSLEKIDLRLTEAAKDLYNNGWQAFRKVVLPLSLPGRVRRQPAHVHPRRRRLHQRRVPRQPEHHDDRHRRPGPVPRAGRLPDRGGAAASSSW